MASLGPVLPREREGKKERGVGRGLEGGTSEAFSTTNIHNLTGVVSNELALFDVPRRIQTPTLRMRKAGREGAGGGRERRGRGG